MPDVVVEGPPLLLELLRQRVATTSLPASVCRNLLGNGGLASLRSYCASTSFLPSVADASNFPNALDIHSAQLESLLQPFRICTGALWGLARKALNIVLLEANMRHLLRERYGLNRLDGSLEVPLDSYVGRGLRADAEEFGIAACPTWIGIMRVTPELNQALQVIAAAVAQRRGVHRHELDLFYWRHGRDEPA